MFISQHSVFCVSFDNKIDVRHCKVNLHSVPVSDINLKTYVLKVIDIPQFSF
jgi:hypothetical protein